MSEREKYEASKEARRTVLKDAGHAPTSGSHMDALLRYIKGSGEGHSVPRTEPVTDADIRQQAAALVRAAGGQVVTVTAASGTLRLRGHVRCRSEIPEIERRLRGIPGVTRVDLGFGYDDDDEE